MSSFGQSNHHISDDRINKHKQGAEKANQLTQPGLGFGINGPYPLVYGLLPFFQHLWVIFFLETLEDLVQRNTLSIGHTGRQGPLTPFAPSKSDDIAIVSNTRQ